ncbi:predicted protein [Nematostella vectensis]|uniref:Uncharacterized protein n=1 Tax=Nematostella vectensis TaxID=45351 RepID=A7SME3_NEMVE|nr:predicted protein [Nematostella vectensis]|eukprot:XP_001627195.1 predicted protein [Nematostella vectensis]
MKLAVLALCLVLRLKNAEAWPGSCGWRPSSSKRIVGGQDAGRWPWQAEILKMAKDGKSFEHKCGGTLINRQWVLTSASCLFEQPFASQYLVKLGVSDRSKERRGVQSIQVSAVRLHRGFLTKDGWGNDIALIQLKKRVRRSRLVRPICLPRVGQEVEIGTKCYMTGWGKRNHGDADMSKKLQEAVMPVVAFTECDLRNSHKQNVGWKSMLCAGYNDNKTQTSGCIGDSGGPLMCKAGDRWSKWVLHGVTSWGDSTCDGRAAYSVFTKVSNFVQWIYRTMAADPKPPKPGCGDNQWYCNEWETKGLCTNAYFVNSLKIYCRKTCSHCK